MVHTQIHGKYRNKYRMVHIKTLQYWIQYGVISYNIMVPSFVQKVSKSINYYQNIVYWVILRLRVTLRTFGSRTCD